LLDRDEVLARLIDDLVTSRAEDAVSTQAVLLELRRLASSLDRAIDSSHKQENVEPVRGPLITVRAAMILVLASACAAATALWPVTGLAISTLVICAAALHAIIGR
jgi:uncharacterized membrane protein